MWLTGSECLLTIDDIAMIKREKPQGWSHTETLILIYRLMWTICLYTSFICSLADSIRQRYDIVNCIIWFYVSMCVMFLTWPRAHIFRSTGTCIINRQKYIGHQLSHRSHSSPQRKSQPHTNTPKHIRHRLSHRSRSSPRRKSQPHTNISQI